MNPNMPLSWVVVRRPVRVDVSRVPLRDLAAVCGTFRVRKDFSLSANAVFNEVTLEVV